MLERKKTIFEDDRVMYIKIIRNPHKNILEIITNSSTRLQLYN